MKKLKVITVCSAMVLTLAVSSQSQAGWSDQVKSAAQQATTASDSVSESATSVTDSLQTLQAGQQAVEGVQATTEGGLTGALMQQLNISQTQAEGGAGAVFQLAKTKMQGEAFSQLSDSVPGMDNLMAAAPVVSQNPSGLDGVIGGISSVTGGQGGTLSSMGNLAASFQQLGMSGDMVQRFIPAIVNYVRSSSGDPLANTLLSALTGS